MTAFRFDPAKGFADNLESFLQHAEAHDAGFGGLLRANAHELVDAADDAKRRAARTRFNNAVNEALDGLPAQDSGEAS
jgi:hypothetical protein